MNTKTKKPTGQASADAVNVLFFRSSDNCYVKFDVAASTETHWIAGSEELNIVKHDTAPFLSTRNGDVRFYFEHELPSDTIIEDEGATDENYPRKTDSYDAATSNLKAQLLAAINQHHDYAALRNAVADILINPLTTAAVSTSKGTSKKPLRLFNGAITGFRKLAGLEGVRLNESVKFFVAATSKTEAVKLVNEVCGCNELTMSRFNAHWSESWGCRMDDITPEIGVWVGRSGSDKILRAL